MENLSSEASTTVESPAASPLLLSPAQVSESWQATQTIMNDYRRRIRRKITKTISVPFGSMGGERQIQVDPTDGQKWTRAANLYRQTIGEDARESTPIEWLLKRMALRVQLDTARLIVERDLGIAQRRGTFRVVDDAAMEGGENARV